MEPFLNVIVITAYRATGASGTMLPTLKQSINIKIAEKNMIGISRSFQRSNIAGASILSG